MWKDLYKLGNYRVVLHTRDDSPEVSLTLRDQGYSEVSGISAWKNSHMRVGAEVTVGNSPREDAVSVNVGLFSHSVTLSSSLPQDLWKKLRSIVKPADEKYDYKSYVTGFHAWRDESEPLFFAWRLNRPTGEWSSSTPWWLDYSFSWEGYWWKHTGAKTLSSEDTTIFMPEGAYQWTIDKVEHTWVNRLGQTKKRVSFDLKCKDGEQIPHPGKGENPFDCGPDATYSLSGPAPLRSAKERLIGSIMIRRGSEPAYSVGGKWDKSKAA